MSVPRISVVIPIYNAEDYLAEAIESVQRQTEERWECILVIDGSPDNSIDIARSYAEQDSRITVIEQENHGVSVARNTGAEHASPSTKYLFFLDADDILEPTALETMSAYLDEHPEVGLLGCQFQRIDAAGDKIEVSNPLKMNLEHRTRWAPGFLGLPRDLPPDQKKTPFVTFFCGTGQGPFAMYRRAVFEKTQGWDPDLNGGHEDTDMFCQMALEAEVHYLSERLYRYRDHGGNKSKNH